MSSKTSIQWTDATWNPVGGCGIISTGCTHCYAMKLAGSPRLRDHPVYKGTTRNMPKAGHIFNGKVTVLPDDHPGWLWPLTWRGSKTPKLGEGKSSLIFVVDMADLFHVRPWVVLDRVIARLIASPHIAQLLTKRAASMANYFLDPTTPERLRVHYDGLPQRLRARQFRFPPTNFWLGFSAERRLEFDERWKAMQELAAQDWPQFFVSVEPMLEAYALPDSWLRLGARAWTIAGGESGPKARRCHLAWFRLIKNQCAIAASPFFMKQVGFRCEHNAERMRLKDHHGGDMEEWPQDLRVRQFPHAA